jgi:hypothetical protein
MIRRNRLIKSNNLAKKSPFVKVKGWCSGLGWRLDKYVEHEYLLLKPYQFEAGWAKKLGAVLIWLGSCLVAYSESVIREAWICCVLGSCLVAYSESVIPPPLEKNPKIRHTRAVNA